MGNDDWWKIICYPFQEDEEELRYHHRLVMPAEIETQAGGDMRPVDGVPLQNAEHHGQPHLNPGIVVQMNAENNRKETCR